MLSDDRDEGLDFFSFLDDGSRDSRRLRRQAATSLHQATRNDLYQILMRTLRETPAACPTCGGLCQDHVVKLRDCFLARLGELSRQIADGVDLYRRSRNFGVSEPHEVITRIYDLAGEHSLVYNLAEPQERMDLSEEEEFEDGEEGDDFGDEDGGEGEHCR